MEALVRDSIDLRLSMSIKESDSTKQIDGGSLVTNVDIHQLISKVWPSQITTPLFTRYSEVTIEHLLSAKSVLHFLLFGTSTCGLALARWKM